MIYPVPVPHLVTHFDEWFVLDTLPQPVPTPPPPTPVRSPYDAMMLAAAHITQNPLQYSFAEPISPRTFNDRGCVVGWAAFFMGRYGKYCGGNSGSSAVCEEIFGCAFYQLMDRLDDLDALACWRDTAVVAAHALRKYANEYCRPPVTQIPAAVREIFARCAQDAPELIEA